MIIYIGADHRGFQLKEELKVFLKDSGYEVADVGNAEQDENDDYTDFAAAVAEKVSNDYENAKGVLICGSGVGVDIVANKFPRVRSAFVFSSDQAFDSRNDDDANIICLGANYITPEDAKKTVATWLSTPFSGEERHRRRIDKISGIENELQEKVREAGEMED